MQIYLVDRDLPRIIPEGLALLQQAGNLCVNPPSRMTGRQDRTIAFTIRSAR
jgi:hypothetical protein